MFRACAASSWGAAGIGVPGRPPRIAATIWESVRSTCQANDPSSGGNVLSDRGYRSVIVAYADAIGLGCEPIERIARDLSETVVIVNLSGRGDKDMDTVVRSLELG